jgi:hypothetical protein
MLNMRKSLHVRAEIFKSSKAKSVHSERTPHEWTHS